MAALNLLIILVALVASLSTCSLSVNVHPHFPRPPSSTVNNIVQGAARPLMKTMYFTQPVDHFGFSNSDTFQQRYIVIDDYWKGSGGPIFFYTGNEGDIIWFMNNTGLMFDWAPEFQALLIFAEHRYYGETLPYGKDSFKDLAHLGYLTAEQALADFATLIDYIKTTTPAVNSPVIAFGGSYGGMLSAWFRIKYPQSVIGALASSAPIWNFENLTSCEGFSRVVSLDFTFGGRNCASNIRRSWDVINNITKTAAGLQQLTDIFKLCKPLPSGSALSGWLNTAWVYMAMVDYPYPANFLMPLPGWPIKVTCSHLSGANLSDVDLMKALKDAVNVYYNYTGTLKCFDLDQGSSPSLGDQGWNFQSCSEMVMPSCSDGVNDMFPPTSWDLPGFVAECLGTYGVKTRPHWIVQQFGGKEILSSSNIIFSNGFLDPWSAGGVLTNLSSSLIAIVIADGAHHLDLRSSNSLDPQSVIDARLQEKRIIQGWIQQYMKQINLVSAGTDDNHCDDWTCRYTGLYTDFASDDSYNMRLAIWASLVLICLVFLLYRFSPKRQKHSLIFVAAAEFKSDLEPIHLIGFKNDS